MKKILVLATFTFLPTLVFAQGGGFQLGIKGGVNLTKLTFGDFIKAGTNSNGSPTVDIDGQTFRNSISESFDSRTGTSFGIYARFGRNLFLQPEILYSTRAGSFDIIRNGQTETVTVKTTSFDIPVLLGIKGGPIRVLAGPVVSFGIDNNQRLGDALKQYTNGSLNDAWAKAYYGYQIGGGLDLGSIGLDVRYQGNISDIAQINNQGGQFSQGMKTWQITLAYKIL